MAELLFQFFRHYGHEFDYDNAVVSVRTGKLLTKAEKHWQLATNNMLCVEEPFNTERNLANTADDTAFRGLHLEFRQAFKRLSEIQDIDSRVCEQFEFPEGGHRTVFERPVAQPKPVLTRSQSQSGRVPRANTGTRGNRYQSNQRHGPNNRRASNPPTFNQNPILMYSPADYMLRNLPQQVQHPHSGMADQLSQLSQQLSQEEQRLRAQQIVVAQAQLQQVQQAQQQAHAQSYVTGQSRAATLPLRQHPLPVLQNYRGSRLGSMEEPIHTAPIHRVQTYSSLYDAPLSAVSATTAQASDVSTDSPATSSVPLRRQYQRAPVPATAATSSRSQSQPARGISQPYAVPRGQYVALPAVSQMQLANGARGQALLGPFVGPMGGQYYVQNPHLVEQIPREYLGYGYAVPVQYMNVYSDPNAIVADSYTEDSSTPSTTQPLGSSAPDSWLSEHDDYVSADNIARSEPGPSHPKSSGPIIVNGSSSSQQRRAETPRHSPPRRRTLDLPPRSLNTGPVTDPDFDSHSVTGSVNGTYNSLESDYSTQNLASSLHTPRPSEPSTTTFANDNLSTSPIGVMAMSPIVQGTSTRSRDGSAERAVQPWSGVVANGDRGNGTSRSPIPPLDLANSCHEPALHNDTPVATPAVLSPVRETNTPVESPVVARTKTDENQPSAFQTNGTSQHTFKSPPTTSLYSQPPPTAANSENTKPEQLSRPSATLNYDANRAHAVNSNPWQQAVSKKKGKGKSLSVERPRGEPMPANEAEKKGG